MITLLEASLKQSFVESVQIVMGGKPLSYYLAGFIFTFFAVLLSVYLHSKKRDVSSTNTPVQFSFKFLLWDNAKRAIATLITVFMLFRLFDLSSPFAMVGVGFFISFGLDKAIQFLMDKTNIANFLKTDRQNFKP